MSSQSPRNRILSCLLAATLTLSIWLPPSIVSAVSSTNDLVDSGKIYTYTDLNDDLYELSKKYPDFLTVKSVGKTSYGRNLWAVKLGTGTPSIFINASHHAREHMTTNLVMEMIDQYANAYATSSKFEGYDVRSILSNVSIWFMPSVNPDGVALQQKGLSAFPAKAQEALLKMNANSKDFRRWKANAEGVDLNRQYPAEWSSIPKAKQSAVPSYMNYNGTAPLTTVETKAVVALTKEIDPEIAVSYHSSGRVLYYEFNTKPENLARDLALAKSFSARTGYGLVPTPWGGGYTDWFIQEYGRPGLTPEIASAVGETSVPLIQFPQIWKENKTIPLWLAQEGLKLYNLRKGLTPAVDPTELKKRLQAVEETLEGLLKRREELQKTQADLRIEIEKLKSEEADSSSKTGSQQTAPEPTPPQPSSPSELISPEQAEFTPPTSSKEVVLPETPTEPSTEPSTETSNEPTLATQQLALDAISEELRTLNLRIMESIEERIRIYEDLKDFDTAIGIRESLLQVDSLRSINEYKKLGVTYSKANDTSIKVYVRGKRVPDDLVKMTASKRTVVSLRAIADLLGAQTSWDARSNTVTVSRFNHVIRIPIDSREVYVDNVKKEILVPATISNGVTYVPTRFLSEALGLIVDWIPVGSIVTVEESK